MPLRLKPHTLTLIEASEDVGGDLVVEGVSYTLTAQTVRGQVTPLAASVAYEKYGVAVKAPHEFLFEIPDTDKVVFQSRFAMGARVFQVSSVVRVWDAEPRTSCASCMLDELTAKGPAPE